MLKETMQKQVRNTLHTLQDAIQNCPDDLWLAGKGSYLVIARLAFHALQSIDYHLDKAPAEYDWNHFGIDWEGSPINDLWDKAQTLAYLAQMRDKALAFVDDPVGLLCKDMASQFFISRLDHLCYVLRHVTQHSGEINALLRQSGAEVGHWL